MESPFVSAWQIHEELESGLGASASLTKFGSHSTTVRRLAKALSVGGGSSANTYYGMVTGDIGVRFGPSTDALGRSVDAIHLPTPYKGIPGIKRLGSQLYTQLQEGRLSGGVVEGMGDYTSLQRSMAASLIGAGGGSSSSVNAKLARAASRWRVNRLEGMVKGSLQKGSSGSPDIFAAAFKTNQGIVYLDDTGEMFKKIAGLSRNLSTAFSGGDFSNRLREWKEGHRELIDLIHGSNWGGGSISFAGIKDISPFLMKREIINSEGQYQRVTSSAVKVLRGNISDYIAMPEYYDVIGDFRHRLSGLGVRRGIGPGANQLLLSPAIGGRKIAELEKVALDIGVNAEGIGFRANLGIIGGRNATHYWDMFGGGDPGLYTTSRRAASTLAATTSPYTVEIEGIAERGMNKAGRGKMSDQVRHNLSNLLDKHGVSLDEMLNSEAGSFVRFNKPVRFSNLSDDLISRFYNKFSSVFGTSGRSDVAVRYSGDLVTGVEISGTKIKLHMQQVGAQMLGATGMVMNEARATALLGSFMPIGKNKTIIDFIGEAQSLKMDKAEGARSSYMQHYLAAAIEETKGDKRTAAQAVANALGMDLAETKGGPTLIPRELASDNAAYKTGEMYTSRWKRSLESELNLPTGALDVERRALVGKDLEHFVRTRMAYTPGGLSTEQLIQFKEDAKGLHLDIFRGQTALVSAVNPVSYDKAGALDGRAKLRLARTYGDHLKTYASSSKSPAARSLEAYYFGNLKVVEGELAQARGISLIPFLTDAGHAKLIANNSPGYRRIVEMKLSAIRGTDAGRTLSKKIATEYSTNKNISPSTYQELLSIMGMEKDVGGVSLLLDDPTIKNVGYKIDRDFGEKSLSTLLNPTNAEGEIVGEYSRLGLVNPDMFVGAYHADHPSGFLGGIKRASRSLFSGGTKHTWERGSLAPQNAMEVLIELMDTSTHHKALSRRLGSLGIFIQEAVAGGKSNMNQKTFKSLKSTRLVAQNAAGLGLGELGVTEKTFRRIFRKGYHGKKAEFDVAYQKALNLAKGGGFYGETTRYPVHNENQFLAMKYRIMPGRDTMLSRLFGNKVLGGRWGSMIHGNVFMSGETRALIQMDFDKDVIDLITHKTGKGLGWETVNEANKEMYEAMLPLYERQRDLLQAKARNTDTQVFNFAHDIRSGKAEFKSGVFQEMIVNDREELARHVERLKYASVEQLEKSMQNSLDMRTGLLTRQGQYSGSTVGTIHNWTRQQELMMDQVMGKEGMFVDDPRMTGILESVERSVGRPLTAKDKTIYSELFYRFLKKRTDQQEGTAKLFDMVAAYARGDRSPELIKQGVEALENGVVLESLMDRGSVPAGEKDVLFKMLGENQAMINAGKQANVPLTVRAAFSIGSNPVGYAEQVARENGLGPEDIRTVGSTLAKTEIGEAVPDLLPPKGIAMETIEDTAIAASKEMGGAIKGESSRAIGSAMEKIKSSGWGKAAVWGGVGLGAMWLLKPSRPAPRRRAPPQDEEQGYPMPPNPQVGMPVDSMDAGLVSFPETARIQRVLGQRTHFSDVHAAEVNMPPTPGNGGRGSYKSSSYDRMPGR